jgi:GT2 family glycosyltransferase
MKVEIYILNYNGRELLEKCLPSIMEASGTSKYKPAVIVIDNKSSDDSKDFIAKNYKNVVFDEMKENMVLCSFNYAAEKSDADIMIFLNNDLVVDKNFVDPLVDIFLEKESVFLAATNVYNIEGTKLECGRTKVVARWGIIKGVPDEDCLKNKHSNISYTLQGGFGAFDRKKFVELGGYDPLYLPGIAEDTDIAFRAWLRGYYCYYQPKSSIYHMGKASFRKRFGNRKLLAISHRNTYFFTWKNITDKKLLAANLFFAIPRMAYALATFKWEIVWGFFWFLTRLSDVLNKRAEMSKNRKYNTRKDAEVLQMLA